MKKLSFMKVILFYILLIIEAKFILIFFLRCGNIYTKSQFTQKQLGFKRINKYDSFFLFYISSDFLNLIVFL